MDRIDSFISNIYRSVQFGGSEAFRESALRSLGVLIPFDGALWGTGNSDADTFHSVITLGVGSDYPLTLERCRAANPILPALLQHTGTAIDMATVFPDRSFYASELYKHNFARFGVERILSYLDLEPRSKVYTLISLYRFEREHLFTAAERALFERAAFHLVHAAMHAYFVHLAAEAGGSPEIGAAICDSHGLCHQAMPEFLDLIEQHYPDWRGDALPFAIPDVGERSIEHGLCIATQRFADLFCVRVWEEKPTDTLGERDRAIVAGVCKGMTFKSIARDLELAPSTVSNRLYRIYRRLGITSRSQLTKLVHGP